MSRGTDSVRRRVFSRGAPNDMTSFARGRSISPWAAPAPPRQTHVVSLVSRSHRFVVVSTGC